MFIINIEKSPLRNRRYRLFFINGDHIDIGLKNHEYYIDNGNKDYRNLIYSLMNKQARQKIIINKHDYLVYESFILNGGTTNLIKNINFYNSYFKSNTLGT